MVALGRDGESKKLAVIVRLRLAAPSFVPIASSTGVRGIVSLHGGEGGSGLAQKGVRKGQQLSGTITS